MIDFQNGVLAKLGQINPADLDEDVLQFLLKNETVHFAARSIRDSFMVTDKRIIAVNIKGLSGKTKDVSSIPHRKIAAFSLETAGLIDIDSELSIAVDGVGVSRFEFSKKTDIALLGRVLATYIN